MKFRPSLEAVESCILKVGFPENATFFAHVSGQFWKQVRINQPEFQLKVVILLFEMLKIYSELNLGSLNLFGIWWWLVV